MDSPGNGTIEMVALGRPFDLGMFYDCWSDSLIPGLTLWDKEKLGKDMRETQKPSTEFKIVASESISDKSSSLGVDASLKASFLSGLVKVEGSAKYLNNNKRSTKQARVTLQYKTTTVFKALTMDQLGTEHLKHREVMDQGQATHVVTGILYGAQAFFVFDQESSEEEKVQDIQGGLKGVIKTMPLIEIDGNGALKMNDTDKKKVTNLSCTFHGDFHLNETPTTFEAAVKVYKDLPKLIGLKGEKVVPVTVYLLPLSALEKKAFRLVRQISLRLVTEAESILENLTKLEIWCDDVLNSFAGLNFSSISKNVTTFKSLCSEFKLGLQQTLAQKLPAIRKGGEAESALAEVLKEIVKSPFNRDKLNQWKEGKNKEVNTIKTITKLMKNTETVSSENALTNKACVSKNVLVFVLTSLGSADPFLSDLEQYLKKEELDKTDSPGSKRWFGSSDVIDSVKREAKLFSDFADANKSVDKSIVRFLSMGLADENHEGSTIHLYEDGFRIGENFEPPSKPGAVLVGKVSLSSVNLTFSAPSHGLKNITGYRVEFSEKGKEKWSHQLQAEAGEVTVSGLKPNTEYSVRVRAVTAVGLGPEAAAEATVRTLACSPPEELQGTASSSTEITVTWKRPAEAGQEVDLSYIIEYGQTQPKVQWKTELSQSERMVIAGLQPDTSYTIKVLCDYQEHGRHGSPTITVTTAKDPKAESKFSKELFCGLVGLKDQFVQQEIQNFLKSGGLFREKRSEIQCSALAYMLQMSEQVLEELDTQKYNMSKEGKLRLIPAVRNCKKAWFKDCNLSEVHCEVVSSALSCSPSHLRELDLSNNELSEAALSALCAGLKSPNCQLSSLRLKKCGVSKVGCSSLASALISNPSHLTDLDLSDNEPYDAGVAHLCVFLQSPQCRLQTLKLPCCGLSEVGCSSLASALMSNPSNLTKLDLDNNAVSDAGVTALCEFLQHPDCSLEILWLQGCELSKSSCSSLASALKSNAMSSLSEIYLWDNGLRSADVKELMELKQDPHSELDTVDYRFWT